MANPAAEALFGYDAGKLEGLLLAALLPTSPGTDDVFLRAQSGRATDEHETIGRHADGHYVDLSITIAPLRGPSGDFTGLAAHAREIGDLVDYRKQVADLA